MVEATAKAAPPPMPAMPAVPPGVPSARKPRTARGSAIANDKLLRNIDNLHRNNKQFLIYTVLGLIFPIILLIAAILGMVYASQRDRIIADYDAGVFSIPDGIRSNMDGGYYDDKIEYMRTHKSAFFAPLILVAAFIVFIVIAMIVSGG